jgi:hypothetical protein
VREQLENLPESVKWSHITNLALFGIAVAFLAGWVYMNIHWLFVGVFALAATGALGALVIIPKLMPEDVGKGVQRMLWGLLFTRPWARRTYLAIIAAEIIAFCLVGYVQIDAMEETAGRELRILCVEDASAKDYSERLEKAAPQLLSKEVPFRDFYLTWPLLERRILVKVSGYPDQFLSARRLRPNTLYAPHGLRNRPVILMRPDSVLIRAHQEDYEVVVKIEQREWRQGFSGHAIWVGCDEDVAIPNEVIEQWKTEVLESKVETPEDRLVNLNFWQHPRALVGPRLELRQRDAFTVQIVSKSQTKPSLTDPQQVVVDMKTFPQVEVWHAPKNK